MFASDKNINLCIDLFCRVKFPVHNELNNRFVTVSDSISSQSYPLCLVYVQHRAYTEIRDCSPRRGSHREWKKGYTSFSIKGYIPKLNFYIAKLWSIK
jgi:hypothetical protein